MAAGGEGWDARERDFGGCVGTGRTLILKMREKTLKLMSRPESRDVGRWGHHIHRKKGGFRRKQ